jgi:hypothetical protein
LWCALPAVGQEGREPVGEEVDEELAREDGREEVVHLLQELIKES